jgi:hypothetical protein
MGPRMSPIQKMERTPHRAGCLRASSADSPPILPRTGSRGRTSFRPIPLAFLLLSWALAWLLASPALGSGGEGHDSVHSPEPMGDVLVAGSVCEAHDLRARSAEDPSLRIEIPTEFAGQWPSRSACESARLAWDPEAPGPMQPIPFSHKHHAGEFQIDCQYCHSGTDRSSAAGVPSVELCMGCHAQFPKAYDEIEGIQILRKHWEEKTPIEWVQIHRLPEYVQFRHNRHLQAGLECQRCHGPVEKLDKLYLVPDNHWKYGVPVKKLEMGWCVDCHRDNDNQASVDCMRCHY